MCRSRKYLYMIARRIRAIYSLDHGHASASRMQTRRSLAV
jgi:hypothetical protein